MKASTKKKKDEHRRMKMDLKYLISIGFFNGRDKKEGKNETTQNSFGQQKDL